MQPGDQVLVCTEEGQGLGTVVTTRCEAPEELDLENIKEIERPAREEDSQIQEDNYLLGQEAFDFCEQKIQELDLEMKLVDVEVRFDQSKIVLYFTAPSRIDFRELVKVLVSQYRTRIELRQIGVRHEAQILGGIGNCGRICCCHQFLRRFEPVTIKMAKEQQLFLNPSKISGSCGRLLCCLNFERANYDDFKRKCPKIGKKYETAEGELKILRANMFRDSLVVGSKDGQELEMTLLEWAELMHKSEAAQDSGNGQDDPGIQGQQQKNKSKSKAHSTQQVNTAAQDQQPKPQQNETGQAQAAQNPNPGKKSTTGKSRKRRNRSRKKKK